MSKRKPVLLSGVRLGRRPRLFPATQFDPQMIRTLAPTLRAATRIRASRESLFEEFGLDQASIRLDTVHALFSIPASIAGVQRSVP